MSRVAKVISGVALGAVVLILIAVVVVVSFDWNRLRPTINERVSTALDRPFAIHGDLEVNWRRASEQAGWRGWFPWMHVTASDLRVGNPEWAADPLFAAFEQVEFRLALLPLIGREVVIPRADFAGPIISLERAEDGRVNWVFDQSGGDTSRWRLNIGEVAFDRGEIRVVDAILDAEFDGHVEPLGQAIPFADIIGTQREADDGTADDRSDAQAPPYEFAFEAKGSYRGQALAGAGKFGGVIVLHDARQPFPLQLDVNAGDTHVALAGTLTDPRNLAALDLQLDLSGRSLADLYALTGVNLPETPKYSTQGRLSAILNEADGAVFHYRDFTGQIGDSDIIGNISYSTAAPRPKLSGEVSSRQLRLVDLGPLIGMQHDDARDDAFEQPAGRVLPNRPLATERWREMDAEVELSGENVQQGEGPQLSQLHAHLALTDGILVLSPFSFAIASGSAEGSLYLDGQVTPMKGHLTMQARELQLRELVPEFEPLDTSLGELNGDATLDGAGNSVAALLGSADGEMLLMIVEGLISRNLMELAGLNVGNYLVGELFGDEEERINCALADLVVNQGLMTTRLALVDTEHTHLYVTGTASLADETMDLEVHPQSKGMRIFSLRSPLYVRGTFKQPDAGVQAGPLIVRGMGALALGAAAPAAALLALIVPRTGPDNPCAAVLQQLQESAPDTR